MKQTSAVQGAHAIGSDARPSFIPRAVISGPDRLSAAARAEVNKLCGSRPRRFWSSIAVTWASIACAIAFGIVSGNAAVIALCVVFISTRQIVLGLLMHEQVHRLGDRSKYGDWLVNLLAVYPLFVTTVEDYAKVHLSHHKYFMTPRDPDFVRKSGDEWTFPKRVAELVAIVARDLSSINTLQLVRGKTAPAKLGEFERRNPTPAWLRLFFYGGLVVALTLTQTWTAFLIYWALPLLTFTQLFVRWIAVVEHQYNAQDADVRDVTPLVLLTWWQKALFPDMNFAMHVYHHMHPGVAFCHLPQVHEIYRREGLVNEGAIFRGQGSFLRYLACGEAHSIGSVTQETLSPSVARTNAALRGPLANFKEAAPYFLLAESNDINALIVERALNTVGFATRRVRDGRAAAQAALFNPRPVALILSGFLSDNDAASVARSIRQVESCSGQTRLPIVVTTALDESAVTQNGPDVDQYLKMPFKAEHLAQILLSYTAPLPIIELLSSTDRPASRDELAQA